MSPVSITTKLPIYIRPGYFEFRHDITKKNKIKLRNNHKATHNPDIILTVIISSMKEGGLEDNKDIYNP